MFPLGSPTALRNLDTFDFDEDFGVVEVIGNGTGVNMESLSWDVAGQEGRDQVPEPGLVAPAHTGP
jgi:hypothetical protein